jgi:REP element-mobilizing transposase RayT
VGEPRRDRRMGNWCVVHVSNRVVEGLPFVARGSVKEVILGILARAQSKHPMNICGFMFMGNHYHMILAGKAHQLSPFMNFVDGEIAKAFRRFTGRYKGKFWEKPFREQKLATPMDVVRKMAYLYANPTRSGLVSHPKEYPGIHSFGIDGEIPARWIRPSKLKRLFPNYSAYTERINYLHIRRNYDTVYSLKITPNAWVDFFDDEVPQGLIDELLKEELKTNHKSFMGARRLKEQSLTKEWTPKKKSRTPFVICQDNQLRVQLIQSYRHFVSQCREAWLQFKQGITNVQFPRGCFIPPKLSRTKASFSFC